MKEQCGVVGIFSSYSSNIPEQLFYSLFSLQHRGQESAGIAYWNEGRLVTYKDLGMVSNVLGRYLYKERKTHLGIGHVRYSTKGGSKIENAQPVVVTCNKGRIALAHNGTLSNSQILKEKLFEEGSIFQSTTDTELILHLISRSRAKDFDVTLQETLSMLEGAYSLVMIYENTLYAVRDPNGFRPLYIGKKNGFTAVASETCALDILHITDYRSVAPGEIIKITDNYQKSFFFAADRKKSQCVFELIYFARPDSYVFDHSVHLMRKKMGAALAEHDSFQGDIVVPVPDSGNIAALGYAEHADLPFEFGLTRNFYAGRSFILPTTAQRELAVRMKLHPVRSIIKDKRIILIDDSLVRGTTSKILVNLIRQAGAKEIHLRLSSPEIKWPCYFGIDIPTKQELISNSLTPREIADQTGADSVMFLPIDALHGCLPDPENFCFSCFTGDYPVPIPDKEV